MNEQKITPKKSEAGIEYIREMRLAGLIKRDIIRLTRLWAMRSLKKTEAFRTEYMRPTKTEKGRTAVLRALFRT